MAQEAQVSAVSPGDLCSYKSCCSNCLLFLTANLSFNLLQVQPANELSLRPDHEREKAPQVAACFVAEGLENLMLSCCQTEILACECLATAARHRGRSSKASAAPVNPLTTQHPAGTTVDAATQRD